MSRSDLPVEFSGPLDFAGLVRTLDQLTGERVGLQILNDDEGSPGSWLDLAGPLQRLGVATADGASYAVGEDTVVRLARADFRGARLSTYDGNDFFQVLVDLRQASLVIGDTLLTGADLTFPER